MNTTCGICIEEFTKQPGKKQACCPYCDIQACVKCTQTYLLNTQEDPHCMGCRRGWSREVLDTLLLSTWLNDTYKKHRQNVLLDRERSRLPAAQIIIENQKMADERLPNLQNLRNEIDELTRKLHEKTLEFTQESRIIENIRRGIGTTTEETADKKQRRAFIMPCPATGCRGFLSTAYKCGVCDIYVCPDCREIKGTNKDVAHTCDPNTLESVRMLKRETRPCPECGINIFKIEGCFGKDTPILLWDGSIKMSQDICIGDKLVGDDGQPRIVERLLSGNDMLYEVEQNDGANYIVNSKHTLVLKYSGDNKISWCEKNNYWKTLWFDRNDLRHHTKNFNVSDNITKEEAFNNANNFINSLGNTDSIEIKVCDYMNLDKWSKKNLMGYKTSNGIHWETKNISFDPYLLGLWLGDGTSTHPIIASNDIEIQKYIYNWCLNNDAELLHEHTVKFRIRRRGAINGKDKPRVAIGFGSNSETCKGCITGKKEICNMPTLNINVNTNMHKTNPFTEQLNKYNLLNNKHIPDDYLRNSREIRLKVLAGIIDSDGHVPKDQKGKRVTIILTNEKLVKDCILLCKSLGFVVHVRKTERKNISLFGNPPKDYMDVYNINLSGEKLYEIPTILPRKMCVGTLGNKDYMRTNINVKELGVGTYYGWSVNGNHRFLHEDFTVLRNCDQMFCTGCHTPFSWTTGLKVTHGAIHNPHYFEYLRAVNGGVMPRNPGDIPCAENIPQAWTFDRELARKYPSLSATNTSWLYQALNNITHIRHVEIPGVTNGAEDTDNTKHNIQYLKNEIDEARWKQLLQQREKRRMKRDEIRQRYEAFVGASADIYHRLLAIARTNTPSNRESAKLVADAVNSSREQLMALREIFNQGMIEISRRYKCQVLYLSDKGLARERKKYETGRVRRVKKSDGSTIGSTDDGDETNSVTA